MLILFFYCAFKSGSDRYYLRKSQGFGVKGKELLYYIKPKNIIPLMLFYFNYYFRKVVLLLLCFSPCALLLVTLYYRLYYGELSLAAAVIFLVAAAVLAANGIFFYLRLNSFLFLARYYFVSGKFFNFRQLFDFSYACLEGKRGLVFRKKLGFFGWFISCLFLLPIGFVRAYYRESMVILAKGLIED